MTAATIKVSSDLRARLERAASAHDRTLEEHLEVLLANEARAERFAGLRHQLAQTPPDERYQIELDQWQDNATWS